MKSFAIAFPLVSRIARIYIFHVGIPRETSCPTSSMRASEHDCHWPFLLARSCWYLKIVCRKRVGVFCTSKLGFGIVVLIS